VIVKRGIIIVGTPEIWATTIYSVRRIAASVVALGH